MNYSNENIFLIHLVSKINSFIEDQQTGLSVSRKKWHTSLIADKCLWKRGGIFMILVVTDGKFIGSEIFSEQLLMSRETFALRFFVSL